jgi:glycyl-tRNA synthetase
MSKNVFLASGHLKNFLDPIVKCNKCNKEYRVDKLLLEKIGGIFPEGLSEVEFDNLISKYNVKCSNCNSSLGKVKKFNLMFDVKIGSADNPSYLRPETCQSIFVDFARFYKILRCKLPTAFAQFGKSFRNEISPRQSILRLREFYQAEIEIFFNPNICFDMPFYSDVQNEILRIELNDEIKEISCDQALKTSIFPNKLIAYYISLIYQFYIKTGIDPKRIRFRELQSKDRAFYSKIAFDLEVETSLGWIELVACNYRTDYDLKQHELISGKDMSVIDNNQKIIPHVFELSMGVDRSIYCILEHNFQKKEERLILNFRPWLAPMQVGIFPLVNKDYLPEKALSLYQMIKKDFSSYYDESGSIGRRYRRADEIGVPLAITIDYTTIENDTVTIRDRNSMKQLRIDSNKIKEYVIDKLKFPK